jgi:hypothetical protein
MVAVAWLKLGWSLLALWGLFCAVGFVWQVAKAVRVQRQKDRVAKMLNSQLQEAVAAGDQLAAYKIERALDERSARLRHPTAWEQS